MELKLFKTLWGCDVYFEEAVQQATDSGFQGIEGRAPENQTEQQVWAGLLKNQQLDYIAEIVTGGDYVPAPKASPESHLEDLQLAIEHSLPLDPLFATCITGYDAWPEDETIDYFKAAMSLGESHGIQLSFETHRSRSLFNPWVTARVVEAIPSIRLTLDMSHWCVVCERLMDSESETLSAILPNIHHVHARVGYAQGPQVPHPAAPEYSEALASHQTIWQSIWKQHQQADRSFTSMTPEFGPDGYLHTLPFTDSPVADLWEINQWMAKRQQTLFQERFVHSTLL